MRINANLFLYKEGRKTPFSNGYRPLFSINGKNYSGEIHLKDRNDLSPGEKSIVKIVFLHDYLELQVGEILYFSEDTRIILGEIEVLEID